jgi:glutamate---cysteine ligase / carboxylate-amine ligase
MQSLSSLMKEGLFTLGIEEEFQIIDPVTRQLRSHITEMIEDGRMILGESIKPELHQSIVEVGTAVCKNIQEARREVIRLRSTIAALAARKNLRIGAASTHPISAWQDQEITPHARYEKLLDDMQVLARSLLIFGLHVHVGLDDREMAIHIMNAARYFLPHVLALSVNSPFWCGMDTGLQSYRCEIFKKFPRTDIPDYFQSWGEYERYLDLLIKTNCIDNGKKIWWDVRPHAVYNTLEFRICDLPMRVDETIAIAALFQAIVAKLYKLIKANLGFRLYRRALIQENKWRAVRWGLDGKLIDFGKQCEVPVRDLIHELILFVDDVVDDLGCREEVHHIYEMMDRGTGASQQVKVYQETKDLRAVVDYYCDRTMEGVPLAQLSDPWVPGAR